MFIVILYPKENFEILFRALRFGDFSNREDRKKGDPATTMSDLFHTIMENSKINF